MYITTNQAGEILGFSKSVIQKLAKAGKLKDYGVTIDGGKQHHYKFKLGEVKEYGKNNGYKVAPTQKVVTTKIVNEFKPQGILTRLDRIESKLEQLIKMWS